MTWSARSSSDGRMGRVVAVAVLGWMGNEASPLDAQVRRTGGPMAQRPIRYVRSGLFLVVCRILLVAIPVIGLLTLVWLVGAYAVVFGLLLLGLAFRLRRHPVRVSHAEMTR